jgi:hypothetical protein
VCAEITLNINGELINLSYEDAESLFHELFQIFGKGYVKVPNYIPSRHWISDEPNGDLNKLPKK